MDKMGLGMASPGLGAPGAELNAVTEPDFGAKGKKKKKNLKKGLTKTTKHAKHTKKSKKGGRR